LNLSDNIYIIIGIQLLGRSGQRPEFSQATAYIYIYIYILVGRYTASECFKIGTEDIVNPLTRQAMNV